MLTALAGHDRLHGYGITQEVQKLSDGRLQLKAGTLYATLDRLSRDGLITAVGDDVVEGRFRRYYSISPNGRQILAREAAERQRVSGEALRRLSFGGGVA